MRKTLNQPPDFCGPQLCNRGQGYDYFTRITLIALLSMIVVKACCSRVCRWDKVPMHHLYPLVGSLDELGNTEPPIVEIDCSMLTAWEAAEPVAVGSNIAPKAMHWMLTGFCGVAYPGMLPLLLDVQICVATLMASVAGSAEPLEYA